MNKIAKTSLGIAAVAAIAGAGAYMAFAWGPSRTTYTMDKPADHVVFNSITDNNKEVGDERYFVSASEYTGDASKNYWSDKTQVENGKEYVVRMYVHNNAASNLNLTAENVRAYVVLPTDTATSITVSGKVYSSNANPTTVWDETTFTSKNGEKFNLAYVDGTAKYYNTKDGKLRTFNLNASNLLTNKGELLGYDKMDGKIPGCSQYSGYLTFHVKAQFAEIVTMIQHTRSEVVRLANASLIDLYWRVGRYISDKISVSEWGDGVVKQLADYIEKNSPEVKGFSDKNLWRMKQFYETYKDADEKLSPLVRQISWTNNLTILSRTKSTEERCFYLEDTFCF